MRALQSINFGELAVEFLPKIEKRRLWVRPIEWLKLSFASSVIHQTRSLGVLILSFIYTMDFVQPRQQYNI